ncbi:SH3 domain-containing protein [Sphingomonas panacisoli]|uniref:SH3 domain-containing protein n=1 Tax=Sphingomonas panacisoli TaxID=1813879 RepID=A0A5B8LFW3_9SPHN|nr:SH3 domain-containing protein [Sphingomonas panacisoli]QDZ07138.1 SH3 domain-containing protein [Sphingomonas panacisoli]
MKTITGLLLATSLAASPAAAKQYPPRDDCVADASFVAFRTSLADIVKRKDAKALLAVVAPDIEWSFGDPHGRAGFAKEWKLAAPATSGLWEELGRMLARGCSLKDGEASAPYWYQNGPSGELADIALINGERVNIREAPSKTAKVVRTADWESVTIGDEAKDWTKVTFEDGTAGYVANDFLWSGYSYRALFDKRGGKWLMTAFIAGD